MSGGDLASAAVVGLVIAAILGLAGAGLKSDLTLVYQRGELKVRGTLAPARANDVRAFFRRELKPSGKVTVRVDGPRGRTPKIRVSGALSRGEVQRIRNALTLILG